MQSHGHAEREARLEAHLLRKLRRQVKSSRMWLARQRTHARQAEAVWIKRIETVRIERLYVYVDGDHCGWARPVVIGDHAGLPVRNKVLLPAGPSIQRNADWNGAMCLVGIRLSGQIVIPVKRNG